MITPVVKTIDPEKLEALLSSSAHVEFIDAPMADAVGSEADDSDSPRLQDNVEATELVEACFDHFRSVLVEVTGDQTWIHGTELDPRSELERL
jgi:hypothetical protein